ncbi:protease Do-like chloroplastic [Raphidocelis subcapitata]|uniref:Protease Do-like chloroplastic n=1 Tax=Raphidocelis subcapitata TaxID=307507 RepID=A0A2V0PNC2_9CHLO|nr:protease Do-like chloroplastic [Raphidocelis subcapitata]|eukprot:GBF98907.1 protease Do-like chloroplastic [Raphidocelis subcapitata]
MQYERAFAARRFARGPAAAAPGPWPCCARRCGRRRAPAAAAIPPARGDAAEQAGRSSAAAAAAAAAAASARALAARAAAALAAAALVLAPPPALLPPPPPAEARGRLTAEEQLTIDVFKRSVPSVVNVTNLAIKRDAFTMNMLEIPQGAGSGFVWDDAGHVVTNYHVTALGGEEFSARVIGVDRDKDIAVLQIVGRPGNGFDPDFPRAPGAAGARPTLGPVDEEEAAAAAAARGAAGVDLATPGSGAAAAPGAPGGGPGAPGGGAGFGGAGRAAGAQKVDLKGLKPLSLCSSSADLVVGQKVFAIGNPFGLDHTLTTGVVSGTGREIQSISGRPIQDVVQTDAAINPGNSGGPLLDSGGCLIGINTAIYSPSGTNSGVGFAIPVDVVRSSVTQIIETGRVVRPVLGISFAPDQSTEQLGVKGILVLNAREGGPAWRAGIRGTSRDDYGRLVLGDIITRIDGARIRNSSDLYRVLDKAQVGQSLDIEVLRGDNEEHLAAVLEPNMS